MQLGRVGIPLLVMGSLSWAQRTPVRPEFEVAAIKPAPTCHSRGTTGRSAAAFVVPVNVSLPPGLLLLPCITTLGLIESAYGTFGEGHLGGARRATVYGGPPSIDSDFYSSQAKAGCKYSRSSFERRYVESSARRQIQTKNPSREERPADLLADNCEERCQARQSRGRQLYSHGVSGACAITCRGNAVWISDRNPDARWFRY